MLAYYDGITLKIAGSVSCKLGFTRGGGARRRARSGRLGRRHRRAGWAANRLTSHHRSRGEVLISTTYRTIAALDRTGSLLDG